MKKSSKNPVIRNSAAEFLIFTRQAGADGIEVRYRDETIWLTQKLMAELFGVSIPTINEHLKNIFESRELQADSVIREFRTTATDGKNYNTQPMSGCPAMPAACWSRMATPPNRSSPAAKATLPSRRAVRNLRIIMQNGYFSYRLGGKCI